MRTMQTRAVALPNHHPRAVVVVFMALLLSGSVIAMRTGYGVFGLVAAFLAADFALASIVGRAIRGTTTFDESVAASPG